MVYPIHKGTKEVVWRSLAEMEEATRILQDRQNSQNYGAVENPFVSMIKSPRRVGFPQGNTPRKPFDTAIPAGFLSPTCSG